MGARFGKGAQLQYESTPGGGGYQTVAGARNITGPGGTVEQIDVTSHDTIGNFRERISGLQDPGELSAEVNFDPNDATHVQLLSDKNAGTERKWRVRWNAGGSFFHMWANAFVTEFTPDSPVDSQLNARLTVTLKSAITFVAEP